MVTGYCGKGYCRWVSTNFQSPLGRLLSTPNTGSVPTIDTGLSHGEQVPKKSVGDAQAVQSPRTVRYARRELSLMMAEA